MSGHPYDGDNPKDGSKVVPFRSPKKDPSEEILTVETVLNDALQDELVEVVVLGMTKDGMFYTHTNVSNTDVFFLNGMLQKRIMDWAMYEGE